MIVASDWIQSVSTVATALAAIVAAYQLGASARQARTTFEDSLAASYRDVAGALPTAALLGEEIDSADLEAALPAFIRYFDRCPFRRARTVFPTREPRS
jgi:hypothetical protein